MFSPPDINTINNRRKRVKRVIAPVSNKRIRNSSGQRSGKWTFEEESFANQLVRDFEKGFLDDCEEGCTLRSYLAKRLNCAPMRISKKFAGRCIGKLAYVKCDDFMLPEKFKSPLNELEEIYTKSLSKSSKMADFNFDYTSEDSGDEKSSFSDFYENSTSSSEDSSELFEMSKSELIKTYPYSSNFFYNKYSANDLVTLGGIGMEDSSLNGMFDLNDSLIPPLNAPHEETILLEADEWKDVLTYFCGEGSFISDSNKRNDTIRP
jgi:hypothetical protein